MLKLLGCFIITAIIMSIIFFFTADYPILFSAIGFSIVITLLIYIINLLQQGPKR